MNSGVDARIDELEAKLSFADDQLDQLNKVIFRQQEQMERLQAQLRLLMQHMQPAELSEFSDRHDLRDEIPPHY